MAGKNQHESGSGHASHSGRSEKDPSGQKGVSQEQVGGGKENDPNNFANDADRAAAADARVVTKATSATSTARHQDGRPAADLAPAAFF